MTKTNLSQEDTTSDSGTYEVLDAGPFGDFLGPIFWRSSEKGPIFYSAAWAQHLNERDEVAAGTLMGFAQLICRKVIELDIPSRAASNVSLNCDFTARPNLGDHIEGRVEITRKSPTMVFATTELTASDTLIMSASGIWRLKTPEI